MNQFKTIVKKELRSYFLSPVALVFLGIFLLVNLFVFFTFSGFFVRNIADIRPMFEWLPILMIFLVAAMSMRSWSEEQASGTLETLMTLPVSTWALVIGKLAAAMILVLTALVLTLPLPIMVSILGNIDSGPVIGGYIGAIFLAAAYMSIGMCVSARTQNQIVSLMVTITIGGLFYLIGTGTVTNFFSGDTSAVLRALGSGSRFYNIERGVLDLRDVIYYASIAAFFITLNVHFLETKRADTTSKEGFKRKNIRLLVLSLLAFNAIGLNLWLAPLSGIRIDMTEDKQFSVSKATSNIVNNLSEPLLIAGYFSDKTHPLLSPLVPGIKDFLMEYKNIGAGKVTVRFENPNYDEELEQEIAQNYNIRPLPFRIAARHQESVVNAYFHILIKYGDEYEVLSIDDLIEIDRSADDIDVRIKNLEYDVTKSIKKVSSGFQSIEAVFASMDQKSQLSFYVTPQTLPEDMKELPEHIREVAKELEQKSKGKFEFVEINLDNNQAKQEQITKELGLRPMATDLFAENVFFLHLILETGESASRIAFQGDATEAAIRTSIESAFKRNARGFIKTIGLFTEIPEQQPEPPNMPPHMRQPQQQPDFAILERHLSQEFKVQRVQLEDGIVPSDIDVLIAAKPGQMNEKQKFAIDQYLMNGGAVIVLAGDKKIQADRQGVNAVNTDPGLKGLLSEYGFQIEDGFVLDSQNANFPVPIQEQKGMFVMRKVKMMEYPFFPDLRRENFNSKHITTQGLQNLVFNWGSALTIDEKENVEYETIVTSTPNAWIRTSSQVFPESFETAGIEFAPPDNTSKYTLAAVAEGNFASYFTNRPSPLFVEKDTPKNKLEEQNNQDSKEKEENQQITDPPETREVDRTGRTIKEGRNGKLAVIASSEFLSDITAQIGEQISGNVYASNFQFARNLIDWATAETDLMSIRTSGTFARTLKPISEKQRNTWEIIHYVFVFLALLIVAITAFTRRSKVKSLLETEGGK